MANKRVSMKGRGADLFFGEYAPLETTSGTGPGAVGPDGAPPMGSTAEAVSPPPPAIPVPTATDQESSDLVVAPVGHTTIPDRPASRPTTAHTAAPVRHRASMQASRRSSTPFSKRDSEPANQQASNRSSVQSSSSARRRDGTRASTQASERDSSGAGAMPVKAGTVDIIRRAVREPGREVAYVRLTPEEKGLVGDVVHAYKKRGLRTTENELHRIAINHLLHDYHEHGDESVLARVLASLHA